MEPQPTNEWCVLALQSDISTWSTSIWSGPTLVALPVLGAAQNLTEMKIIYCTKKTGNIFVQPLLSYSRELSRTVKYLESAILVEVLVKMEFVRK